jgi:23S rRNA (guanosine2251-2'-O)-methyltransferase
MRTGREGRERNAKDAKGTAKVSLRVDRRPAASDPHENLLAAFFRVLCVPFASFAAVPVPAPADNPPMSSPKVLFGFHAVGVRLKTAPKSVVEVYYEATRKDARMRQFLDRAQEAGVRLIEADTLRIAKLAGSHGHQGVAARVEALPVANSLDDLLDAVEGPPLLLVLDGVTDPHNLGACLRVADGAGAHAVIAPKDHAVGVNATVAKVASGAAETVPYFMVTNLARTLGELKERNIWCIGTSDDAPQTLYQADLKVPGGAGAGRRGHRACASSRARPATSWCPSRCTARSRA